MKLVRHATLNRTPNMQNSANQPINLNMRPQTKSFLSAYLCNVEVKWPRVVVINWLYCQIIQFMHPIMWYTSMFFRICHSIAFSAPSRSSPLTAISLTWFSIFHLSTLLDSSTPKKTAKTLNQGHLSLQDTWACLKPPEEKGLTVTPCRQGGHN